MKRYYNLFSLFFIAVIACTSYAQPALTEESEEVRNEEKNKITYQPVLITDQLSDKVNEQSGMIWYKSLFWVHNDSGGAPKLFAYAKDGVIQREVTLVNARNKDWEDITDDEDFIYIGDFGNNRGNRKDLKILRLRKSDIGDEAGSKLTAEEIKFEWADQKAFERRTHKHDFDCEAFFAYKDSLYLFTKNWANHKTRMYVAPKEPGHYKLQPRAEFDVNFLVTGADISSDGKLLALVGYKDFLTYMFLFFDFEGTHFFKGKQLHLDLSPLGGAQTEAVVFGQNDSLYISTEKTKLPHALYKVDWMKWKALLEKK